MTVQENMTFTADQFAKFIGCEYVVATNFLRLLADLELAKREGTIRVPGRRGKGKTVYSVVEGFGAKLDSLFSEGLAINPLANLTSDLTAASVG